jgi:hypothetical protein
MVPAQESDKKYTACFASAATLILALRYGAARRA